MIGVKMAANTKSNAIANANDNNPELVSKTTIGADEKGVYVQ